MRSVFRELLLEDGWERRGGEEEAWGGRSHAETHSTRDFSHRMWKGSLGAHGLD